MHIVFNGEVYNTSNCVQKCLIILIRARPFESGCLPAQGEPVSILYWHVCFHFMGRISMNCLPLVIISVSNRYSIM